MGRELRPWWLRIGRIIYIRFKALSIYIGLCDYVCLYCIYRTISEQGSTLRYMTAFS